jgi:hypothetical protein
VTRANDSRPVTPVAGTQTTHEGPAALRCDRPVVLEAADRLDQAEPVDAHLSNLDRPVCPPASGACGGGDIW